MPGGRMSSARLMVTVAIVISVAAMAFGLIRIFARLANAPGPRDETPAPK